MKSSIENASILITGANGGIGAETVKLLVEEKAGRIALACRTQEKAQATVAKISNNKTKLEPYGGFDMTDANSIQKAVEALPKGKVFDIVFLQSGGMIVANNYQFVKTNGQNIERTVYQNVFGGYITLRALINQGLLAENARVVFAGGEGARGVKGMIDQPNFKRSHEIRSYIFNGNSKYKDINALGVSKFMSALLVQRLALEDPGHSYVWFSPGLTAGTKGLENVPRPKRFVMEKIGFPVMQIFGMAQGPKQAAQKYVECLKGIHGESGDLIGAPERKALGDLVDQKPMFEGLTNHQFRDEFWKIITDNCGDINYTIDQKRLLEV